MLFVPDHRLFAIEPERLSASAGVGEDGGKQSWEWQERRMGHHRRRDMAAEKAYFEKRWGTWWRRSRREGMEQRHHVEGSDG